MDFPIEILAGVASGIAGFLFKAQANAIDANKQVTELLIKKEMAADQLANNAAKRGSPVARKVLAYMVIGTFVCGLLAVAFADIPVSLITESKAKSFLFGLFKWGGDMKVVTASGFVLPPWSGWVVSIVIGFFMGTGSAKPTR